MPMPVCDLKNEHFLYHAPARFYQEQYLPLAQELCPKDTALLWPVEYYRVLLCEITLYPNPAAKKCLSSFLLLAY